MEPFSPKHNVIVGRNGSGKSNFFAAIRFVLGDSYNHMNREERQGLLHEGAGSAVTNAYVEIIFDNSDGRFPTGKDELILRRSIGVKKDEYSLDRKNATKQDVNNLLESAGFSRSNSYYIVPQGKVTSLTNMKDSARLELLKEIAGTQVYEARRTESLKIMTETNNKRAKIDELLAYIQERLEGLESEKKELHDYQEKDRERRCLEYSFYHREQIKVHEELDRIEGVRQDGIEAADEDRQAFLKEEAALKELEVEISKLKKQMDLLHIERRQLEEDRKESAKAQANVELKVKALTEGQSSADQMRQRHERDLKSIKQEIATKEAELAKIIPEYNKFKAQEAEVKTNMDNSEALTHRLHVKQGRNSHYKSKAERDQWLRREIADLNVALNAQKAGRMNTEEDINQVQADIQKLENEIAGLRERLKGWSGTRQALSDEVTNAKVILERINDERKVLRREDDKLESQRDNARVEKDRAEKELANSMDRDTARGLASVRQLKKTRQLSGAYGTIAELLEVPESYRTAVEQTAGNSLFHYIVDNANTATLLINELQDRNGGRVTFVPLAQLRTARPPRFPKAQDAIIMIEKIKFDRAYEKAFAQVFGKTIICPNLAIAGQYSRSHEVHAITPDGDTLNKRGAITG
jgi:structural maintenance of chromosome 3 (chondroitin sulfate proteoglycan 6)